MTVDLHSTTRRKVSRLPNKSRQNALALEVLERFVFGLTASRGRKSLLPNTFALCRKSRNTRGGDTIEPLSLLALRAGPGISEETDRRARQNEAPFCFILSLFKKEGSGKSKRIQDAGVGGQDWNFVRILLTTNDYRAHAEIG